MGPCWWIGNGSGILEGELLQSQVHSLGQTPVTAPPETAIHGPHQRA